MLIYDVGIRDLKAHLSAYLERVEAGERLTVTDRGRPVAVIVPIDARPIPAWLDDMVARREAAWRGGKPVGLDEPVRARGAAASAVVIEDRR